VLEFRKLRDLRSGQNLGITSANDDREYGVRFTRMSGIEEAGEFHAAACGLSCIEVITRESENHI
jgi:hypothetical protein